MLALLVLVMLRSVDGTKLRETLAELLAGFGSATPLGRATDAVLVNVPVAELEVCAVKLKVAVPFTARLTVALMLPLPLGAPQLEPADAVQVQVAPLSVPGKTSVTVAPVTAIGPLFVTTMV